MSRITIIDDDRSYAENVAAVLRKEGYETAVEDNTSCAVEALAANPPNLILLDVMFPEDPAGGFELARQIRRTGVLRDVPILMLTGVNQELPADFSEKDIDGRWMPVQGFFEKPPDFGRLLPRIRELLRS